MYIAMVHYMHFLFWKWYNNKILSKMHSCSISLPRLSLNTKLYSLSLSSRSRLYSLGSTANRLALTHSTFALAQMQPRWQRFLRHSQYLACFVMVVFGSLSFRPALVSRQEACGHGLWNLVWYGLIHEFFCSKPFDERIGVHGSKMHFQWEAGFWDLLL